MCWNNEELVPIVLKKPLKVYKIGHSISSRSFISAYKKYKYRQGENQPTIELTPDSRMLRGKIEYYTISRGYHAFITPNRAISEAQWGYKTQSIGIFEIPVGAKVYINFIRQTIVSSDIKYLTCL